MELNPVSTLLPPRPDVCVVEVPPLLTLAFAERLTATLARAADDDAVRLVAFAGSSAEVFSRGLDLEAVVAGRISADAGLAAVAECLKALYAFPKPKLALVRGTAVGGGVGLAAACDWVVAADTSSFALPELLWGFVPAAIVPLVMRRIGAARTEAWALTAVARSAQASLAAGLVDEVVPEADLGLAGRRAVKTLLRPDPAAVSLLRTWVTEAAALPVPAAIDLGSALSATWLAKPEVRARLETFFGASYDVPWGDKT
jgi:enoyl-CoA hydratase/carnithine racemase